MAHKKAAAIQIMFNQPQWNHVNFKQSITSAATVMGKIQYPRTQTDWKKEMLAPNSWALMVTIADPPQTVIKTAAKTKLAWLVGAFKLNNTANARQTNKGPLYQSNQY